MKVPDIKTITPNQSRECQLRKAYPEFCRELEEDDTISKDLPFTERVWLKLNGKTEAPRCPVCGAPVKFKSLSRGYRHTCSKACSNKNPEKIEKTKTNNTEKYGVSAPAKLTKVREKMKKTVTERYGTDNPLKNKEIRERMMKTCIERHGGLGNASENSKKKQIHTMIERYGVKNAVELDSVRQKIKTTLYEKYGSESTYGSKEIQKRCKDTLLDRYGVDTPIKNESIKEKIKKTNLKRYGVEWFCQTKEYNSSLSNDSKANKAFANILNRLGIEYDREVAVENRRYDFHVGDTLIEINPTATHNSTFGIKNRAPLEKTYHADKTKLAEKHGFTCIHIWDWDDPEMIAKSMLAKETLYARECIVSEITTKEANAFIDANHFQGRCRGTETAVGIKNGNELVGVMTFGKPRYNKNFEKELLRLCFKSGLRVTGGAAKMFKYYIKKHDPASIISYCDRSKFSGRVYEELDSHC